MCFRYSLNENEMLEMAYICKAYVPVNPTSVPALAETASTRSTTAAYKDACRLLQKHTRALKSDWWERKAVELQRAADSNNMKGFYNGLKEVWAPKKKGPVQLKSNRRNGNLL